MPLETTLDLVWVLVWLSARQAPRAPAPAALPRGR